MDEAHNPHQAHESDYVPEGSTPWMAYAMGWRRNYLYDKKGEA